MLKEYKHGGVTWVDLNTPTREEVKGLMGKYNISPLVAQELLSPTQKPKLELYDDNFYLILHFPAAKHTYSLNSNQEVDFVVTKDAVITTRYDTIDPVHKFSKEFELNAILNKDMDTSSDTQHAGHLFYMLLLKLYSSLQHELEYVESSLQEIEENIFLGKEKEMVEEISQVSRILLVFKQAVSSHEQALESLRTAGQNLFGDSFIFYVNRIADEHYRIMNTIGRLQETMTEMRETNNSLLSTKQNEVMKTLTIMAFVTFPLTLIAGIFGMNAENIPLVGVPHDFWLIIAIMVILVSAFFIFFKQMKWL